ncbi:unnamed protein product [Parascedosporium putredinis]|uniref:NACHT domain-containing protein n=1 Tax=Parascedosporium putredinis TaxID=1442378 RepID=A0A9P1H4L6_9PEZI|nr:unnamed protein product [Parascedosporium putredinis]CAI7996883.1 unnamed protein product [Parascedosporium putredinis]
MPFSKNGRAVDDAHRSIRRVQKLPDLGDIKTCDQLYDAMDELQAEQTKHGPYKNLWLARIHPFVERLRIFSSVVDVLAQVKPDILGFIWAPIKLILMSTARWREGFEKAVEQIAKIGQDIPDLKILESQIAQSTHSKGILALYFADLLDFYAELLHLFYKSKRILAPFWPGVLERLDKIRARMRGHIELITRRATFQHIRDSEEARVKMLKEFREAETSRVNQAFVALEASISPRMYDDRLAWLTPRFCPGTSKWLERDAVFLEWVDRSTDMSPRVLWLQGIPGAGKTFLASQVTTIVKEAGPTLFAFPRHDQMSTTDISILHSLLFQLASYDSELPRALIDTSKHDLKTKPEISAELLSEGLKRVGGAYIVVDGLDEMEEFSRKKLLLHFLQMADACSDLPLRLFFSSRAEDDINATLSARASIISAHANNAVAIQCYVNYRIKALLASLANKAKGMFLYAKIVIDNVKHLTSIDDIRCDLEALPEDLDEVYIFKHESKIINMSESVLDLLTACTTYLSYDALDPELEGEQVQENILKGRYRFQQFASLYWFALAKKYVRSARDSKDLGPVNILLQNLHDKCENQDFRVSVDEIADGSQEVTLPTRSPPWPHAPAFTAHTVGFLEDHLKDLWTSDNGEEHF